LKNSCELCNPFLHDRTDIKIMMIMMMMTIINRDSMIKTDNFINLIFYCLFSPLVVDVNSFSTMLMLIESTIC